MKANVHARAECLKLLPLETAIVLTLYVPLLRDTRN
jgi:hypothetical protein